MTLGTFAVHGRRRTTTKTGKLKLYKRVRSRSTIHSMHKRQHRRQLAGNSG